jgi:hypothetical protein
MMTEALKRKKDVRFMDSGIINQLSVAFKIYRNAESVVSYEQQNSVYYPPENFAVSGMPLVHLETENIVYVCQ